MVIFLLLFAKAVFTLAAAGKNDPENAVLLRKNEIRECFDILSV